MKKIFLFSILLFTFGGNVFAQQNRCLTKAEAKKIIESLNAPPAASENQTLRKEMLAMRDEREKLNAKIAENFEKNQNLVPEANRMGERHLLRVCQFIKETGWLTEEILKKDGLDAFKFLIRNNKAFQAQRELFPVLVEAAKKKYIENYLLAELIDSVRVSSGAPQIFGTAATVKNNVIYLYPLTNDKKVDEWRKLYDLPPLLIQIKRLEAQYFMPVLKTQRLSASPNLKPKADDKTGDTALLGIADAVDEEVVKIDTKLVNLNLRILADANTKTPPNLNLTKEDFIVSEDGAEQEIEFFTTVEQPFDLCLVLDFSGSTAEKRGLIKKAAQRFVEYARPTDRIAIVAFTDAINVVSELTSDKDTLVQKIKEIEMTGGSWIWDSLKATYKNIIEKESRGRRSAVVLMTDGEDKSAETSFADLMEMVRRGDTTVFSVYIDNNIGGSEWMGKTRRKSQQSLQMLADESGGQFYKADDVKDLNGIYEQIVNDLGKVYSVGYVPKNEKRDGGWRNLAVKIKTQPNLIVRTRRGYYSD